MEVKEANMTEQNEERSYEGTPDPSNPRGSAGPDTPPGRAAEYHNEQLEAHQREVEEGNLAPASVEERQAQLEQQAEEREAQREEEEQQREEARQAAEDNENQ